MSSPWIRGSEPHTHFITRLHHRLALLHTLTHHCTPTRLPEPERRFHSKKEHYLSVFGSWVSLGVDQTPLLSPEAGLIQTLVLTSLMSVPPKLVPELFWVPFVQPELASSAHKERSSLPPDQHSLVVPGKGSPPGSLGTLSQQQQGGEITTL
jgi:hypothetical protein